jgi:hypothetical protein
MGPLEVLVVAEGQGQAELLAAMGAQQTQWHLRLAMAATAELMVAAVVVGDMAFIWYTTTT